MKKKHWKVSVFNKTSETIRDDTFYTTDTEAYLIFELTDEDFTPDSATVTVYNVYGKATINANVEVANGIVSYEIPEEAIGHPGGWRTQVVYTKDNEDYTTGIIEFDVGGHLLDNKKPAIVDIENWNSFIVHAGELIDDWEQLEEIRQANEQQRELAESARQANELIREEAEGNRQSTFETNEMGRQSEFGENELARESAESVRVAKEDERELNEAERISKDSERDSKIETFVEDANSKLDSKADVSALELYAKKKQEDWITPTLLNVFTGNVRYRKTQFGHLEIYGTIKSINPITNTAFDIFSLPSGYIPAREVKFEASDNAYYTFRNARMVLSVYYKKIQIYTGQGGSSWEINVSIPINYEEG